jgi:hypothetical protein
MRLLNKIFHYITLTSVRYGIDESHSTLHSMNTLIHASNMLRDEMQTKPELKSQERLIHTCALLHDMIDHKYVEPKPAMLRLRTYFRDDFSQAEMDTVEKIITTCSYSKVQKNGYPRLDEYQTAYHIVREADLLSSYDFDRTMTYMIRAKKATAEDAYLDACHFFQSRVFNYIDNGFFFHSYSKRMAPKLQDEAIKRIWMWKYIYETHREDGRTGTNTPI